MSCMNSVNMIIVNGVRSEAKCTFDHPGRDASSIVDFAVVDEKVFEACSDIVHHDCRETLDTDHWMLTMDLPALVHTPETTKKPRLANTNTRTKRNMDLLKR